ITFTPTEPVHSIAIGSACDLPVSFARRSAIIVPASPGVFFPYVLLDDLLLTVSSAQTLAPVISTGSLCEGDALVIGSPPMGSSAFQWYHNGIALPGEDNAILDVVQSGSGEGWYTLTSLSHGQCLMGSTHVAPGAPMRAALSFGPTVGCSPLEVEFVDQSVGSVSATWLLGDGATRTDSAFVHTYQDPGTYDLRLTVSDHNGCMGDTLIANALTVLAGVEAFFSMEPNTVFVGATEVELNGSSSTGEITQWSWILGEALPPMSEEAVVQATFPSIPGLYPVLLVVSSADGCMDTVQSVVRVVDDGTIEMPNVFSPNRDGANDRFIPMVYDGSPARLEIYDRWGQRIFSTRVLAEGWPGSGASEGTYFYEVIPDDPIQKRITGFVTLLR
ncbi:MAG TPA: PKD domain-containing protein, partial [Flavobacteriales bacterium]|nr:PKD domain-containing protein [Flavobacteriales bacterium]